MKGVALIILIVFFPGFAEAKRLHAEKEYQARWCTKSGGQTEVRLPDQTRVDCVTATHAVEFDFGSKWAEAIGQALYYSVATGKKAGIVLILEEESDYKYWIRLNTVIREKRLDVDAWIMRPEELKR